VPRFFFDLDDGDGLVMDNDGLDLPSLEVAKRKAVAVLPDIARDVLPDGDMRVLTANVRDESGRVRVTATLTLIVEVSPG
jgi:hypothetical protein